MVTALPPRIMDYRVSASSPTGELLTLGSILEEAGAYASTSSDRSRRKILPLPSQEPSSGKNTTFPYTGTFVSIHPP